MSTIVIARKNNSVCIAADTLTSFGELLQSSRYTEDADKIFCIGESYIGIVGSAAHELVMKSILSDTEHDFSSRSNIFESLRKLHPKLKDRYFLNPKDDSNDSYESTHIDALLINKEGTFGMFSLREVFEYSKFWAIGSGADFALGAMFALYDREDMDATTIAAMGVKAGSEFDSASAIPMTSYTLELEVSG